MTNLEQEQVWTKEYTIQATENIEVFDRFATLAMFSHIVLLMAALHCDLMNEQTSADMMMDTV